MLPFTSHIVIWLIGWAFIGSTLGFFTIRNNPTWSGKKRFYEYLKSISVGIFFALPTCTILCDKQVFTQDINVMIAGSAAFFITDMLINLWPKILGGLGTTMDKIIDKLVGKI